jgi:hypothetical protein
VEVLVLGQGRSALHDSLGRLIDGNNDGQPGGNAVVILSNRGTIFLRGAQPPV